MTDEHQCVNFNECGEIIPITLTMCNGCLDAARDRQRRFFEERVRPTVADYEAYLIDHGYTIP